MPSSLEPLRALSVPEPNTGCWLWLGADADLGLPARAWEALNGAIPRGMSLRPSCGTGECVNPAHLHPEGSGAR
jgi:hypothetical protein